MQTKTPDDIYNNFKTQAREAKLAKAREKEEAERRSLEEAKRKAEIDMPPPFVAYYHKGGGCSTGRSCGLSSPCSNELWTNGYLITRHL